MRLACLSPKMSHQVASDTVNTSQSPTRAICQRERLDDRTDSSCAEAQDVDRSLEQRFLVCHADEPHLVRARGQIDSLLERPMKQPRELARVIDGDLIHSPDGRLGWSVYPEDRAAPCHAKRRTGFEETAVQLA